MEEKITMKLFSDISTGEIFVSRLVHFQDHILSGIFCDDERKKIQGAIMSVLFDGLEPAFRSLRDLRKKWSDVSIPEKEKLQLVENVFTYLVIAYKDRFQNAAKIMGYEVGFLFKSKERFENGCEEFKSKNPSIDPKFLDTIKEDRRWSDLLLMVRNNIIDHKADKDPILVEQLSRYLNLDTAEVLFENCWRTIEDFLAVFANDKYKSRGGIKMLELIAYREDKNHPKRFGWFDAEDRLSSSCP